MPPGDDDDLGFVPDTTPGDDGLGFEADAEPARTLVLPETSIEVDPAGRRPDVVRESGEGAVEIHAPEPRPSAFAGAEAAGTAQRSPMSDSDRFLFEARTQGPHVAIGNAVSRMDPRAALAGAAQGASLGFADEWTGVLGEAGGEIAERANPQALASLRAGPLGALSEWAQRAGIRTGQGYDSARDATRGAMREAQRSAPGSFAVGEIGGTLPAALIPGGQSTALARIGASMGVGAGLGALAGAGESEAEDVGGIAQDAVTRGVVEGALAGGGSVVGEVAGPAVRRLGEWAEGRVPALQRLGEQAGLEARGIWGQAAQAEARARPGGSAALLEQLDELGAPLNAREMPDWIDRELATQGPRVGETVREMQERGAAVAPDAIRQRLEALAQRQDRMPLTGRPVAERLRGLAGELPEQPIAPQDAWEQRIELDRLISWANQDPAMASLAGQRQALRRSLSESLGEAADSVGLGDQWADVNRRYALAAELDDIARGYQRRNTQGGIAGAETRAAGFGQAVSGPGIVRRAQGLATMALGPAAMQEARYALQGPTYRATQALIPRLQAMGPRGARWAAVLDAAQRRGQTALAAAHYALSRRDPEYRSTVEQMQEQEP